MILSEYEIKFERWNILSRKHEVKYDFVKASSVEQAKSDCRNAYGDLIDIISVEVFST